MWEYTEEDDPTRVIQGGFFEGKSMQEMMSLMFKGKVMAFHNDVSDAGFNAQVRMIEVSTRSHYFSLCQFLQF